MIGCCVSTSDFKKLFYIIIKYHSESRLPVSLVDSAALCKVEGLGFDSLVLQPSRLFFYFQIFCMHVCTDVHLKFWYSRI